MMRERCGMRAAAAARALLRAACGFPWLLRVIDHEAVLLDPKLFLSMDLRPVLLLLQLLKRRFGRQTS
jgi:hypothetical protein